MKKRVINFFKKNWLILLILIIVATWFTYSYFIKGIIYYTINSDVDSVVVVVNSLGFWSYFVFVLLVILECVLAPIPPLVLYIAGGVLFGAFFGGILTLFGNIIGAGIDFFIARRYARGLVEKKVDTKLRKKFDDFSQKYGGFAIFLLRVNPLTTSDLVSYLAGLSKMKAKSFLIWTAVGLIPLIFIQTYLGEFFIKENPILYTIVVVLSILYLIIFVYLIWKSLSKKKDISHNIPQGEKLILPEEIQNS
jgi:uncharacterized membrane protein YdjX (TVP38/TMEM64 family)